MEWGSWNNRGRATGCALIFLDEGKRRIALPVLVVVFAVEDNAEAVGDGLADMAEAAAS